LIFDEPTNELDPVRRRTLWQYLSALNREQGVTVVLTTHNLSEAEHVVERVAVIDQGHLVALATPGELKRQVADQVRLEVRLRDGYLDEVPFRASRWPSSVFPSPCSWASPASPWGWCR